MGDNRNKFPPNSRFFGLVSRNRILAKAILRIWPLSSFGGLGAGPTLVPTLAPTAAPTSGLAGLVLLVPPLRRRRHITRELALLTRRDPPGT